MASPTEIRKMSGGAGIRITWTDGTENQIDTLTLRDECKCAACRNELTGEKILSTDSLPKDITIQKIDIVGNYAVSFRFSDGHQTGIYTFDHLKKLGTSSIKTA